LDKTIKRLIGEHLLSLTDKNRVVIPSSLRQDPGLKETLFISMHNQGLLEIYPKRYWQGFIDLLYKLPHLQSDVRNLQRLIFSSTVKIKLDSQGRFVISEQMFNCLEIDHDKKNKLYVIGAGDRIEIWEEQRWLLKKKSLISQIDSLSDRIALLSSK
jgi:MraZ protein